VQLPDFVIFIEALGFVVVILAGTWFLIRGVREHRESEERYRQMASHIQEIFWMLDAESRRVLEVNEAYETITGRTRRSLLDNPTSYEEIIHPEDRVQVLARLDEATRTGKFNERFRITSPMGTFAGCACSDFRCAMLPEGSGGSSVRHRTLPNRNRQKIKLLRT
jgi:PAS domain S-box-containing protein